MESFAAIRGAAGDGVPRDPEFDALIAEVDQALAATRAARRILADMERGARAAGKALARRGDGAPNAPASRSLRVTGMTVPEAAAVLGVSDERVRVMLRKNQLSGVEFGGRVGWRLDRRHVLEMAERWEAQRRGQTLARDPALTPRRRRPSS